jgi:hypothetical protein
MSSVASPKPSIAHRAEALSEPTPATGKWPVSFGPERRENVTGCPFHPQPAVTFCGDLLDAAALVGTPAGRSG